MKQELSIVGIEANDIGRQHIDGEIRRELRNVSAVMLCNLVSVIACHEVSTRTFAAAPDASASRILRLPALGRQARALAFLTLAFLDNFAARPAALGAPDARIARQALQTRSLAGPNRDDLRLST